MRAPVEHTFSAGVGLLHHSEGPGISVLIIIGVECSKLFLHIFCLRTAGIHISHLRVDLLMAVLPLQAIKPPQSDASISIVIRR